jgi:hypothetical protein
MVVVATAQAVWRSVGYWQSCRLTRECCDHLLTAAESVPLPALAVQAPLRCAHSANFSPLCVVASLQPHCSVAAARLLTLLLVRS